MPAQQLIQRTAAHVESLPSPVGGWNARDSLANMDPMDAVQLTNLFPSPSSVNLRGGYTEYATGLTGQVNSLMVYDGGATKQMFACDGSNSVFDVSVSGAVGAAVVTGLSNNILQYANISTPGGNFLEFVN